MVLTLHEDMQFGKLCATFETWNAERPLKHSHAERGNAPNARDVRLGLSSSACVAGRLLAGRSRPGSGGRARG